MTTTTVGEFTYDTETGKVSGPAAYMKSEHYSDWKTRFVSGRDVVFNAGAGGLSPSVEVAMLVSLQTNYAGWHGLVTLGLDGKS